METHRQAWETYLDQAAIGLLYVGILLGLVCGIATVVGGPQRWIRWTAIAALTCLAGTVVRGLFLHW
ncbi:MAG: hypothetical protein HY000_23400 [Planctomycetes bacterium]|nr:hypothetical protein [Planctomycetota bacterium]